MEHREDKETICEAEYHKTIEHIVCESLFYDVKDKIDQHCKGVKDPQLEQKEHISKDNNESTQDKEIIY